MVVYLSILSNLRKKLKNHKTLVSVQASAPGTITVRSVVQTSVGECVEMVLSPPAVKKKKENLPPSFFRHMDWSVSGGCVCLTSKCSGRGRVGTAWPSLFFFTVCVSGDAQVSCLALEGSSLLSPRRAGSPGLAGRGLAFTSLLAVLWV